MVAAPFAELDVSADNFHNARGIPNLGDEGIAEFHLQLDTHALSAPTNYETWRSLRSLRFKLFLYF
jgi:hypothetical protein